MQIRRANPQDAGRLRQIYAPFVEETAVSFETTVPSTEDFSKRIASTLTTHEWLVAEEDGHVCGYAYGTPHRAREAYRMSVETSVYIDSNYRGKGIGKRLYQDLFTSLRSLGFHNAYAGITLPNDASVALHQSIGFEAIGIFREVGYKKSEWHDVSWWQRSVVI